MSTSWLLVLIFSVICYEKVTLAKRMKTLHEWRYIDYDYGCEKKKEAAVKSGEFDRANCAPIDVDTWHDKTFVTVIRDKGVPSSLNVMTKKMGKGGPLLAPYPSWDWTKTDDCSGITSVYRVAIDRYDRLWVLDTGVIGENAVCPPQLLVFDLKTSKLLRRVKIPRNVASSKSGKGLLVTPIVQTVGPRIEDAIVYIADVEGYGIITYKKGKFFRWTSSALVPDPKAVTYTINGQSFTLEDGPVGMALSPLTGRLYFSPMSSHNLAFVNTTTLLQGENKNVRFRVFKDILSTQSSAKAISKTGILFFGLVNSTSIGSWKEFTPLDRRNIDVVAEDSETLQFTSGMKIKEIDNIERLILMTNRFQRIATGTLNFDEVNFRILMGNVAELSPNT